MLQEEPFCNHHKKKKKKRNINCYVLVSPDEFELTFFFSVFLALLQKCILWGEDGFYKL